MSVDEGQGAISLGEVLPHKYKSQWTLREKNQLAMMWQRGDTVKEIARQFKCHPPAITEIVNDIRRQFPDGPIGFRHRCKAKIENDRSFARRAKCAVEAALRQQMIQVYPAITEPPQVSAQVIIDMVARKHGLTVYAMLMGGTAYVFVRARHEAMYELQLLGLSTPVIARLLKLKDHTTVLHGIKSHRRRMSKQRAITKGVQERVLQTSMAA